MDQDDWIQIVGLPWGRGKTAAWSARTTPPTDNTDHVFVPKSTLSWSPSPVLSIPVSKDGGPFALFCAHLHTCVCALLRLPGSLRKGPP